MTRTLALALVLLGGWAVPQATAAAVATPNACRYSFDASWHDQDVTYDVTATPNPSAPGASFSAGGTARADLPPFMTSLGFTLGLLKAGENRVPARAWIALAGPGGVQVVSTGVEFVTTIQTNALGLFADGAPLTVTVPLPATAWTAPQAGAAAVTQAGPGTLPAIPGTGGAPPLVPLGSFYIEGALGFFAFQLDCQPGRARPDGSGAVPQAAPALDTVAIAAAPGLEPPPVVAPPVALPAPPSIATGAAAPPALAVVSAALTLARNTVRLTLRCHAARPCRGTVAVRSDGRVLLGSRLGPLMLARRSFTLAAGRRATVVLSLTPAARRLMRTRRALAVRVVATPAAGSPVSRRISLRRS